MYGHSDPKTWGSLNHSAYGSDLSSWTSENPTLHWQRESFSSNFFFFFFLVTLTNGFNCGNLGTMIMFRVWEEMLCYVQDGKLALSRIKANFFNRVSEELKSPPSRRKEIHPRNQLTGSLLVLEKGYTEPEWMRLCWPSHQGQRKLLTIGEESGPKEVTVTLTAAWWKAWESTGSPKEPGWWKPGSCPG